MKRTCFVCHKIHDDGGPVPSNYDNGKAMSSCICPVCLPMVEENARQVIEKNNTNKLMKLLERKGENNGIRR